MAHSYDPDVAQRMAEMEPVLLHLLTEEITTLAHWDVLRFLLAQPPTATATLDAIALASNRDGAALVGVVGDLVSRGWLARRSGAQGVEYLLTPAEDRQALLERLQSALHDRPFQLQALYHWLGGTLLD